MDYKYCYSGDIQGCAEYIAQNLEKENDLHICFEVRYDFDFNEWTVFYKKV